MFALRELYSYENFVVFVAYVDSWHVNNYAATSQALSSDFLFPPNISKACFYKFFVRIIITLQLSYFESCNMRRGRRACVQVKIISRRQKASGYSTRQLRDYGNLIRIGTLAIPFTPFCQFLSEKTLKAVGPSKLVSMPVEVKYTTSLHWKCVT